MKAYRRAAVASTFSPTHLAVLNEACGFVRRMGCSLDVLHAAAETAEKRERFEESFARVGCVASLQWLEASSPGEALIGAAKDSGYDLLIAGALEREPHESGRAFTGSVARQLLTGSPCDVLLLPRPNERPLDLGETYFATEPGADIAPFVLKIAALLGLKSITILVADSPFVAAIAASRGEARVEEEDWEEETVAVMEGAGLAARVLRVNSNTGFGLCDAVQGGEADLLVVRAAHREGRTHLPGYLDWLSQVIPTRLLVCGKD